MDVIEHALALDLDPDQIGDLEEAAIGELLARRPPMDEPPDLVLMQLVDRLAILGDRLGRPR